MQEVRGVLLGRVATAKGPQCTALVVENDKNEENSQRTGRKDLLQIVPNGVIQQPAVKTQELVNGDKQPGIRPPEPETKKAEETQALHPPMSFQAMPPSTPVTGGPTPHPCEVGTSKSEQKLTEAFDQNAKHPHDCTPAESREIPIVKPDKSTGGLAAFASSNKRPAHPVSTPAKVARKHPTCESHTTVPCRPYDAPAHVPVVFPHEDDAQPGATKVLQGVGATDCKGLDGHVVHDTKRETDPPKLSLPNPIDTNDHGGFVNEAIMGTNHDDGLTQDMLQAVEIHERLCHEDTSTAHCIQVIRQDDYKPTFIKVAPHATVRTITVAETRLGSLNPPICVNTCVGTRVLSAATTQPFQQISSRKWQNMAVEDRMRPSRFPQRSCSMT